MSLNLDKSNWKTVTFGDVVKNLNITVKDPEFDGIDRTIAMEHLDPGELKITRWGNIEDGTTFTRRVKPGQTLFGKRRAYQRKAAYAEFDAITSGDILVFEANPDLLLPEFLPFLVQSDAFYDHALKTSAGSLSPRTSWADLADYEFLLPTVEEQRRLSDLLWGFERHQQSLTDESERCAQAQSIWFSAALDGTRGERLPVHQLVRSGPTNGKSSPGNDERRGVPTLSISAVRHGQVRGGDSIKYIDVEPESVANFVIEPGDFLVVRGNGNKRLTGLGGLATAGLPEGCIYPDLLIRLRFDDEVIRPEFAAMQWNSTDAHEQLLKSAKSTNGIWKINGKDLKSHRLVVPTIAQQDVLLERASTFEAGRTALEAEMSAAQAARGSAMIEIFGGK